MDTVGIDAEVEDRHEVLDNLAERESDKREVVALQSQDRDADQQTIGIAHADCPQDAEYLASLLRRNHPPKEILTVGYEPVTGSHVGPGTLALFFEAKAGCRSM